jgi:PAS domain-containing protein
MAPLIRKSRPQLRLVESTPVVEPAWTWFCGHCATATPNGDPPPPSARVCESCSLGLLLETRSDIVPTPKDAFLVVDSALLIQAVSRRAEALLEITEAASVNQPLLHLLVPADAEAAGPSRLAAAVTAAMHDDEPVDTFVRPWNTFGVRMRATVAPCGPPRAALVVLDRPRPRLRAVV